MKKLTLCIALACTALTSPAFAQMQRPLVTSNQPVPEAEAKAVSDDLNGVVACAFGKGMSTAMTLLRDTDFGNAKVSASTALGAANPFVNNYTQFKAERSRYFGEIAVVKLTYGCN